MSPISSVIIDILNKQRYLWILNWHLIGALAGKCHRHAFRQAVGDWIAVCVQPCLLHGNGVVPQPHRGQRGKAQGEDHQGDQQKPSPQKGIRTPLGGRSSRGSRFGRSRRPDGEIPVFCLVVHYIPHRCVLPLW